jgi:hypothetical protein
MSSHIHTIARNATKTGAATVPDPNLAPYATTASVAIILNPDPKVVGSMANVLLRLGLVEAKFTPPAPTVPGAPTSVVATAGDSQASVAFVAPSSNGGAAITGYMATSTPGSHTASGASAPLVVTGLTNGTAYTFTVHATNSVGNSAESSASASVTPAGLTRPFAAPVTTNTVTVSGTIDHTGATDVRAALQAIIDGAANGTEIDFPGGGVYKIAYGLTIAARSNLVIDGKGAELVVSPGGYAQADSPFVITGTVTDLAFRDFTLTGSSPTPGIAIIGNESQAGFKIIGAGSGVTRVEVSNNLVRNMYGDGVETIYEVYSLWVHDNTFTNNGRSNITMQCGDGYLVERNAFYLLDNNVSVVDIEPYEVPDSFCYNFTFRNNNIYGESGFAANFYFAANNTGAGPGWGNITDLTFDSNTCWNGSMRAIIGAAGPRPQRVTITNNVCHGAPQPWNPDYTVGPPKNMTGGFSINHADTVTVTGNSVTFSPTHVLAVFTDCTSVTKDF